MKNKTDMNNVVLHTDWLLLQYGDGCRVIELYNGDHPAVSGGEYISHCAISGCHITDCPLYKQNGRPKV